MNMTENKIVANNGSSIILYTTDDGNTQLEVKLEKETSHPGRRRSLRSHSIENAIMNFQNIVFIYHNA